MRSNDENTLVHRRRDAVVENVHDEPTLSLCKIMPEDALDTPATQATQSRKPTIRLLLFGAIFTPVDEEKYDFSLQAPRSRRDRRGEVRRRPTANPHLTSQAYELERGKKYWRTYTLRAMSRAAFQDWRAAIAKLAVGAPPPPAPTPMFSLPSLPAITSR